MTIAMNHAWTGFSPTELARLTIPKVVEQHASQLAFHWEQRARGVVDHTCRLSHLRDLDELVEANLYGLTTARESGWRLAYRAAATVQEPPEVFAAAVLCAQGHLSEANILAVLEIDDGNSHLDHAIVSALGWADIQAAQKLLGSLLRSRQPRLLTIGLSASRAHRSAQSKVIGSLLLHAELAVRCAALRTIGDLGMAEFRPAALQALSDTDELCRIWAAWAALRLGSRNAAALAILQGATMGAGKLSWVAANMWVRVAPRSIVQDWLSDSACSLRDQRLKLRCRGSLGDPTGIEPLLLAMRTRELSRTAGHAFSAITGLDLEFEDLVRDDFGGANTENIVDNSRSEEGVDEGSPWPEPDRVENRWRSISGRYNSGTRYMLGHPLSASSISLALAKGTQPQRAMAALEYGLEHPEQPTPNVAAPVNRQRKRGWTS